MDEPKASASKTGDKMTKKTPTFEVIPCEFCNKEICECEHLICPFHGFVKAVNEDKDGFHCEAKSCDVTRTEKELE